MNNSSASVDFVCDVSDNKWTYILLIPLPLLSGLTNVIVWLAATFYRKKLLRQSYVYTCVTSTLISNAFFLSFHLWEEIALYEMPAEMAMMNPGGRMEVLWTLCTAAPVSFLFVVCGNLTVLIYVMLDSTYFQKSVRLQSRGKAKKVVSSSELGAKRRKAAFLIAFVWVVPIVITTAAVLSWNCSEECHCGPTAKGEICPRDKGCSRTWMPMKNSFIAVNIALWFLEVIILICVTVTGIKNFQDYNFQSSKRRTISSGNSPTFKQKGIPLKPSNGQSSGSDTAEETSPKKSQSSTKALKVGDDDVFKPIERPRKFISINPRLRLVTYLSLVFIICTLPIPIAFFADVSSDYYPTTAFRIPALVFVQLYTLICPVLLVKYMSNLKTALLRMSATVCCCCGQ